MVSEVMQLTRERFYRLLEPRLNQQEEARKQEFVFNVIVIGCIFLAFVASIIVLINSLRLGVNHGGVSTWVINIVFAFFLGIFLLSKSGRTRLAAYFFIGLFYTLAVYDVYNWGADDPQGILTFALVIVTAGILVGTRITSVITALTGVILIVLTILQNSSIHSPNNLWKTRNPDITGVVVFFITLFIIMLVSWLSNREIEKSLKRARKSELALKKERDLLEVKVEERTKELKRVQLEKMAQTFRLAEFGRLASGLFHDLVNPLTAVSWNLTQMKNSEESDNNMVSGQLKDALEASKKIETLIEAMRKQIQQQEVKKEFLLNNEINEVLQILHYKAVKAKVNIRVIGREKIFITGNPLRLYQSIANIISNAIDAYDGKKDGKREILIKIEKVKSNTVLMIQDWGKGIPKADLGKVFEPFYTTKDTDKGMGIGLSIAKDLIERDFKGNLEVVSGGSEGTIFKITIPLKKLTLIVAPKEE